MKISRGVKTIIIGLVIFVTLACGCNLSGLNLQDKIASLFAEQLTSSFMKGKTGDVYSEEAGLAFTTPRDYEAQVSSLGTSIMPKNYNNGDPIITVFDLKLTDGKGYSKYLEDMTNTIKYSDKVSNISEESVSISGYSGQRFDYTDMYTNVEDDTDTYPVNSVNIILDLSPDRVVYLNGTWRVEQDPEVRPIFEEWLATLQIFDPVNNE